MSVKLQTLFDQSQESVPYPASILIDLIREFKAAGKTNAIYRGLQDMSYDDIRPSHQAAVLGPYVEELVDYLDWALSTNPKKESVIEQAFRLVNIGIKSSELKSIFQKHKDQFVWFLLLGVKSWIKENHWLSKKTLQNLVKIIEDMDLKWPELAIISNTLNQPTAVKEDLVATGENYNQLIRELLEKIEDQDADAATDLFLAMSRFWMLGQVVDYVSYHVSDKTKAKWFFDLQKHQIVFHLLEEIKESNDYDYLKQIMKRLRRAGVDWSELDIIQHSLDADKKVDEDTEPASVADDVYQMLVRSEARMDIWYVIDRMVEWKMTFKKVPRAQELFDHHKREIIVGLLQQVKAGSTGMPNRWISALHSIGVEWPELQVIRNSILADRAARSAVPIAEDDDPNSNTVWYVRNYVSAIEDNLSNANTSAALPWMLKLQGLVGDLAPAKSIIEKYKTVLIKYAMDNIKTGSPRRAIELTQILDRGNIGVPELNNIFVDNKHEIIKNILHMIQKGKYDAAAYITKFLMDEKTLDWPELTIIKNSLDAGTTLTQS